MKKKKKVFESSLSSETTVRMTVAAALKLKGNTVYHNPRTQGLSIYLYFSTDTSVKRHSNLNSLWHKYMVNSPSESSPITPVPCCYPAWHGFLLKQTVWTGSLLDLQTVSHRPVPSWPPAFHVQICQHPMGMGVLMNAPEQRQPLTSSFVEELCFFWSFLLPKCSYVWSWSSKGIVLEKLDVKQTCFPPFPGEFWDLRKNVFVFFSLHKIHCRKISTGWKQIIKKWLEKSEGYSVNSRLWRQFLPTSWTSIRRRISCPWLSPPPGLKGNFYN